MRRGLANLTLCGWLLSAVVMVQGPADFSGRWTSEPEAMPAPAPGGGGGRGGPAGDMGSGWGSPMTITQDAKSLTVEYTFFARGDLMPPLRFTYTTDGSESNHRVMMGRGIQVQTSRARWVENALVITTRYPFHDPATGRTATATVTRTLRLESPTALVVESVIDGVLGGPPSTSRTVYRRAEERLRAAD